MRYITFLFLIIFGEKLFCCLSPLWALCLSKRWINEGRVLSCIQLFQFANFVSWHSSLGKGDKVPASVSKPAFCSILEAMWKRSLQTLDEHCQIGITWTDLGISCIGWSLVINSFKKVLFYKVKRLSFKFCGATIMCFVNCQTSFQWSLICFSSIAL